MLLRLAVSHFTLSIHPIVQRFFGNDDVMHMAFTEAGYGLPDEGGIALQFSYGSTAAVPHSRFHTVHQLIHHGGQRTFVWNTTFGNQLLRRTSPLPIPRPTASPAVEQVEIGATVTDPVTDPTSPLASDPKIQDDI